jgi:LDH2 family malate/lactate/ureidoglycolate dehydrogenase
MHRHAGIQRLTFHNTKPAPGTNGPLTPGDPEREAAAIRSKDGIPLLKAKEKVACFFVAAAGKKFSPSRYSTNLSLRINTLG